MIEKEKLPDGAQKLLDALAQLDGHKRWVQRAEMSALMGKKRLTAGDMAYLEMLEAIGFIESTHESTHTPMGFKWMHRLKSES